MSSSLNAAPKAEVFDVEELVNKVWRGEVRIPAFQRPLRWGFEDARRLVDSILRGYPIGNLLLWARPAEAEVVRLGALRVRAPRLERALWVVDGQQRVTTLANALSPEGSRDERFGLSVDLSSESVVRTVDNAPAHVVPLPVLFDLQELMRWFRDHPEVIDYFDTATGVAKRIRQAEISASVVVTNEESVLREIFDRVNNYGKRLKRAEVFAALHPAENAGGVSFETISEEIAEADNFGVIDVDTVMKAILARRGPDIAREIRLEFTDLRSGSSEFPTEDLQTAYRMGAEALTNAVHFLQRDADVPHVAFLPYKYLLIVLARVFAHHPISTSRERRLLKRWFWRAAAAGPSIFPGSTTGAARTLCTRVIPGDVEGTFDGLIAAIPEDRLIVPDVANFRTNHAAGKIIACAMWSLRPRSLADDSAFGEESLADVLDDAQTPRDALTPVAGRSSCGPEFAYAAGRWLLSPGDALTPAEVVDKLRSGEVPSRTLESHGITGGAAESFFASDIEGFLRKRNAFLRNYVSDYLSLRWEVGFESARSLESFVYDDLESDYPEPEVGAPEDA